MYNKQTWLDEIPDMTKPIYDAAGKQKTDPQTGRPLFELVQAGTRITSNRLNNVEGGIEAAHTLVEQLGKGLGGNFVVPIDGTMGLLCSAQGLKATWTAGIAYVNGRRYQVAAGEMSVNPTQGQYLYVDVDGVVKKTPSQTTAKKGLTIFYVATDTSGVISTTDHRVNISLEEILKKIKDIDIKEAVTGGASGLMTGADAKFVRVDGETKTGAQTKADAVKEYVNSRLDIPQRTKTTLQPGLQVIQADQDAPFALTGLTGRTLVNLLGVSGRCDVIAGWVGTTSTLSVETKYKTLGDASLKITGSTAQGGSKESVATIPLESGKYYIVVGDVMLVTGDSMSVSLGGIVAGKSNVQTDKTKFSAAWSAYNSNVAISSPVVVSITSAITSRTGYFDALRVYEISASDYAALDSLTPEQVAAKYSYTEGIKPVRNPYAIRYGENLLPPFYEYVASNSNVLDVVKPYVANVNFAAQSTYSVTVAVISGQRYTLALSHNGRIGVNTVDDSGNIVADLSQPKLNVWITDQSLTFTVPAGATKVKFNINNGEFLSQPLTFSNPMLTIGNVAKPFKPREDIMLALQTELHANPLTGANADEVFEKDGQYFKLKKWRKRTLDENSGVELGGRVTGYRQLVLLDVNDYGLLVTSPEVGKSQVVKYDGKVMVESGTVNASLTGPDQYYFSMNPTFTRLYFTVSNTDTGWGDSYNPTADEVKAYFMGWKMYDVNTNPDGSGVYNRTDGVGKWFVPVDRSSGGVNALPTTKVPTVTSYQLLYQLVTPIVEPITSEGQLTLIEGSNQVEVGTGIVLREETKPALSSQWGTYEINSLNVGGGVASNPLKYKAKKVMTIYKNGRSDKWERSTDVNSYGLERAYQSVALFDPSAAYTVTYLMLDTFPIAPFVGSVPDNEKALLTDLVQDVQQGATSLAVLERSLSEALKSLTQQQNKRNVWGPIE